MTRRLIATIVLSCFNHERYIARAIKSALSQDYNPLEIIVSDDRSTDRTAEIAASIMSSYTGPHEVRLNLNLTNLGVGAHTDKLARMASGDVLFLSAGDDIDMPDRVSRVMAEFASADREVMAVSAPSVRIDERGKALGTSPATPDVIDLSFRTFAATGYALQGPAAYSKRVFDGFEPMGASVRAGEDLILPLRAALLGEIRVLASPVSYYRQHGASLMGSSGSVAPSAVAYRNGLQRYLGGIAAARTVQLRDFRAHVAANGRQIDPDGALEKVLEARARQDGASAAMASGDRTAALTMLRCLAGGEIGLRSFVKTMAMTNAPTLWYRYIRRRHAAAERTQAGRA